MKRFSAKQRKFMIQYVLTGKAGQSAMAAGYSTKDARSRASKMLKVPEIRQEVARLTNLKEGGVDIAQRIPACGGDPRVFLRAVMNGDPIDIALRVDAEMVLSFYRMGRD